MKKFVAWLGLIIISTIIISVPIVLSNTHPSTTKDVQASTVDSANKKNGVEVKTQTESIAYSTTTVDDSSLEYGKTKVKVHGVKGEKTVKYEITYKDDVEISRTKISEETASQPVNEVISKGTKIVWRCYDATSYNKNPYDDNRCVSSTGETRYVSDSQAIALDPDYTPGKSGHSYYNSK